MVWIIPFGPSEQMFKQLICLMTNIEANKHIFDADCKLIEKQDPFNVYENEFMIDEYRFVKGYLRYTSTPFSNNVIEERLFYMNKYMPQDIATDLSYGYPTAHYTTARVELDQPYSRIVIDHNQKSKTKKNTYHFIWIHESFGLNDLHELQNKKSKSYPESYELMRSLSTIIYDNGNILQYDYYGRQFDKPIYNVNYPELWQIRGNDKIVNIPITLSDKFGVRVHVMTKFTHLIPSSKKFSENKRFCGSKKFLYTEGYFKVLEKKEFKDLVLCEIDKKESIFAKMKNLSDYKLVQTAMFPPIIPLDVVLRFITCHICFTPLYDLFYYIIKKNFHIPICALCGHNGKLASTVNVGVSKSPFTVVDVLGMIPKPNNVKLENYEKYKQLIGYLLNNTIEIDTTNPKNILYEFNGGILVNYLTPANVAYGTTKDAIFLVEFLRDYY